MSGSDEWGGLVAFAAMAYGGYWLYNHYEVRKIGQEPVAIASLSAATAPARPTGMIEIASGKQGIVYRLNAESVRGDRKNRQGWIIADASKDKSSDWRYHHTLFLVDCDTTAIRELSTIYYNAKGDSLWPAENSDPKDAKPKFYPEGTLGYAPIEGLCAEGYDASEAK